MALLKCPECGNNVSSEATACPHCGFAIKQDKKNAFTALYRHGTGVQKVNQLFADELMMVLR